MNKQNSYWRLRLWSA